ncbi:MAG: hypothetical protein KC593_21275 [Myxococcales bacterium]|nr:hypothetical protein [Myxococcales bacterium]MCB9627004.1 hypothetical protein [Sandaracinaceae bacterium]
MGAGSGAGCADDGAAGGYPDGGGSFDGGVANTDLGPPPEQEVELSFEPPAVGATVLFATNTGAGRVAVVHADDFRIETVAVGAQPLPAVAVPGQDVALSLNRGDSSVDLLRSGPGGVVTEVQSFPLAHAANRVAFSPDGLFAVLYEAEEPGQLRTNLQDITVMTLTPGDERLLRVVVGYGPSRITFDQSGGTLFVVTEDGVSVVDLGMLPAERTYRAPLVSFRSFEPVIDTQITPDGTSAVTRVAGVSDVRLLSLLDGTVSIADLDDVIPVSTDPDAPPPEPALVTDMDLSPSGDEVFVVLRSHSLLVRIPVGPGFADSSTWRVHDLSTHMVGAVQLSSDGRWALLYSTTNGVEAITRLDLSDPLDDTGTRLPLRKGVRAVAFSSANTFALVLHDRVPGDPNAGGLSSDQRIDRQHGYSVIDLATGFTRLELTAAEPRADGFVIDDAGGRMLVALRNDASGVRAMQIMDLETFAVDELPLLAPPTTLGTFPGLERAFVGQEADGGRVTFYLWPTEQTQTVAGFELGAGVRR